MKDTKTETPTGAVIKASETRMVQARRIDEIASGAMELFKEAGSFESELKVAQAMSDLRLALTPELMEPVMSLINTDLGFRTDRDPKITPDCKPYAVDVVRDCVIEAKLRGFHVVGQEFNIIAGRFYAAKNGLKRKCEQWKGLTDLKVDYGVPKNIGDKGAVVAVKARWIKDGIKDAIDAEIPVRVNSGMGADAIIGKAERKIYKRIHDRLSGVTTPDGEANEDVEVAPAAAAPTPRFDKTKSKDAEVVIEKPADKPEAAADLKDIAGGLTQNNTPTQPSLPADFRSAPTASPQQALEQSITGAGHTFAQFVAWGVGSGNLTQEESTRFKAFSELSDGLATRFIGAKAGLLRALGQTKTQ